MYSGNKDIKNTFLIKRHFATYVAFSNSIKIEIFDKGKFIHLFICTLFRVDNH